MKKSMILGMALGLGVFALSASSALALGNPAAKAGGTGIVDSYHDLSSGYGDAQSRICVFCHHPHQAQKAGDAGSGMTAVDYSPLWNHTITLHATGNGGSAFIPYSNGNGPTSGRNALNADVSGGPGGPSILCLSCHDGSVALNAYSAYSSPSKIGGTGAGAADSSLNNTMRTMIGENGDLSNHHPIGFDYNTVVTADPEIALPTAEVSTGTTIGDLLYGGSQFECITCHDVHNSHNTGEKFLWKSNDGSAFCLTCHLKDGNAR